MFSEKIKSSGFHPSCKGEVPVFLQFYFLILWINDYVLGVTQYNRCETTQGNFKIQEIDTGIRKRVDDGFKLNDIVIDFSGISEQICVETIFNKCTVICSIEHDKSLIRKSHKHNSHFANRQVHVLRQIFRVYKIAPLFRRELFDFQKRMNIIQSLQFQESLQTEIIRGLKSCLAFSYTADHFHIDNGLIDLPIQCIKIHIHLVKGIKIRTL